MTDKAKPRALVIGGSLGGLFAGNSLRSLGWEVEIYERSPHDLDSRGGGIVLQPAVVDLFRKAGVETGLLDLGVRSNNRTVLRPDGSILRKDPLAQTQTSWSLIYTTMKAAFGEAHYRRGMTLTAVDQDRASGRVSAIFADGTQARGDLLIGADGNGSTVRQLLWPDAIPRYAGYLAWRGLVPEAALPTLTRQDLAGDFGFASNSGSHILGYLVPGEGNDIRPGRRLYNWVWYRVADLASLRDIMTDVDGRQRGFSLPEGKLAPRWKTHLGREAASLLPPAFRDLVQATEAPFAQAIRDLTVERMVKGRVILLGDAAFIPRPHTAASTAKAAINATALAEALARWPEDPERALQAWEPQQLELGQRLFSQGVQAGQHLLFR
ncbi:MAG: FAD binding domain-containing protein [Rhodospirillales bacterium]